MNMLRAALLYASLLRWPVFPVHSPRAGGCSCRKPDCTKPGKHPCETGWQTKATTDAEIIRAAWARWPEANIGIPCGAAIKAWVLDVDRKGGGDDELRDLEAKNGDLPRTPRSLTGGGGFQLLFAKSAGLIVENRVRVAPGIDTRADRGLIVVAPSLHASGRRYVWDVDAHPTETPIAEAPPWLLELVAEKPGERKSAAPTEEWIAIVRDGAAEGKRNQTAARLTGHLLRKFVDSLVVVELLRAWNQTRCRPPLPEDELLTTVDSVCASERRRRRGTAA